MEDIRGDILEYMQTLEIENGNTIKVTDNKTKMKLILKSIGMKFSRGEDCDVYTSSSDITDKFNNLLLTKQFDESFVGFRLSDSERVNITSQGYTLERLTKAIKSDNMDWIKIGYYMFPFRFIPAIENILDSYSEKLEDMVGDLTQYSLVIDKFLWINKKTIENYHRTSSNHLYPRSIKSCIWFFMEELIDCGDDILTLQEYEEKVDETFKFILKNVKISKDLIIVERKEK